MNEIKQLRDYLKFRQSKGSNMDGFIDAVDTIEAYINALEMQRNSPTLPLRELCAKLILFNFERVNWNTQKIARLNLEAMAFDKAAQWVQLDEMNLPIYDKILADQVLKIKEAALQTVDELIETQNQHSAC